MQKKNKQKKVNKIQKHPYFETKEEYTKGKIKKYKRKNSLKFIVQKIYTTDNVTKDVLHMIQATGIYFCILPVA
ncbi:MAG TPA: hypothetical protein DEP51_03460 [Clostridiales bacterium]|nr:hypothetical protein [Clostridiales bacterium]